MQSAQVTDDGSMKQRLCHPKRFIFTQIILCKKKTLIHSNWFISTCIPETKHLFKNMT